MAKKHAFVTKKDSLEGAWVECCSVIKNGFEKKVIYELRLQGGTGEVGGDLAKGNVYLDGNPVCDAGWSQEDALVACRW